MKSVIKRYTSAAIDVTYDVERCIHVAECVRGLPQVFNKAARPWVSPQNAPADEVAEVILRCPTGALHYQRKDGGTPESAPPRNRIVIAPNGPHYVRGAVIIKNTDGDILLEDTRIALCRCGKSDNKPVCDNAHITARFADPGQIADPPPGTAGAPGPLTVTPQRNGPLMLEGDFEILSADGQQLYRGSRTFLCRCGGSSRKPFCDGTHKRNGFTSE
jgi:CDGSH-type Zn-finger protein/uncharacterized Fe-S cluster protein YjdI